ncbi:hypothetical protein C361_05289 [Cryptococcus neoformans Tu259-1]|uniref:DUF1690 domain-containing protein n=1 Tax=Cryptococcus neoformans Tu259-1 TaxID=1230072 RepID=A0A854Q6G1_CRYNE|nr:hypothetical protein C353_04972 [Cryptococcus neoformans var. grubii AD1-83a]OXG15846.1 hypothetical protein C361_05289 [Cryptococcus neoformans var. grubii Tu259-1]OXG53641.1 hypothetical protein C354_04910 [Cryptococcus neoformans var. grubii MW-RSA1955]OXG56939.1 hypothetical protein C352_04889 [Cryptococcus neoformans var. grubii CHC193]OXG60597.1 hypothetical protein C351_04854 [Cryptococcus neoformans var. grubii c8]OXH06362.1 hypothetical protein C369_04946 [Cryptococcus neoformans v
MGAAQSSQPAQDQLIQPQEPNTSVQFSPALISRLASPHEPTAPTSNTDDVVRRRLAAESAHLRAQEADILKSISAALEKENLDREKPGMSSEVLGRDIDEIREKVERMKEKRNKEGEGVKRARQGVEHCYLANGDKPLDCWKEVEAFKAEVAKLEQAFVKSLQ